MGYCFKLRPKTLISILQRPLSRSCRRAFGEYPREDDVFKGDGGAGGVDVCGVLAQEG
jgi:hypothetical protein